MINIKKCRQLPSQEKRGRRGKRGRDFQKLNSHGLKEKNDKIIFAIASNIKGNKWQKH
jgi:hypothetical protein